MLNEEYQDYPDPAAIPTVGFLPRLGAAFIDLLVLGPISYGIYHFMVVQPSIYVVAGLSVLNALYKPLAEAIFGYTVGKYLLKMKVVDRKSNQRITLNQSFTRFLPWAVAAFASLFVLVRVIEAQDFTEVDTLAGYMDYLAKFPLSRNFLVSLLNNFPIFSAVWIIMDPWKRALHDRWAETFVVKM